MQHGHGPAVHQQDRLRLSASVLTIGAFDGVHGGHRALIRAAVLSARRLGVPAVVYTFDPPPKVLLSGAMPLIAVAEKISRIGALGVDHIVLARFDAAYRSRTAAEFIGELCRLSPRRVLVGPNFRFGACKSGNADLLARFFDTEVLPALCCEAGEIVSSSRIRALREAGNRREADRLEGWTRPLAAHERGDRHVRA